MSSLVMPLWLLPGIDWCVSTLILPVPYLFLFAWLLPATVLLCTVYCLTDRYFCLLVSLAPGSTHTCTHTHQPCQDCLNKQKACEYTIYNNCSITIDLTSRAFIRVHLHSDRLPWLVPWLYNYLSYSMNSHSEILNYAVECLFSSWCVL